MHNTRIDYVMIPYESKNLIGAKMLGLELPGFPVETGPKATVQVIHML